MESIKSLQENPFFKNFGVRHNIPPVSRTNNRSETLGLVNGKSLNEPSASTDGDENEIGEYRPVSGFVHKLLDKFSSLSAREDQSLSHTSLKRSTSLDENDEATNKSKVATDAGTGYTFDKPSYLSTTNLSHRARSIENLNHIHRKSQQYKRLSLQFDEEKLEKTNRSAYSKFQKERDLSRDNIIIIENTPTVLVKRFHNDESNGNVEPLELIGNREVAFKDELPKPNTVLTVRSIFENASSGAGLYTRKHHKSDQPLSPSSPSSKAVLSPLQTEITVASQISVSKRGSIQLSSPTTSPRHETHARPVLLSSSAALSRPSDYSRRPSDSYLHSRSEDVKSLSPVSTGGSEINHSDSHVSPKDGTFPFGSSKFSSVPVIDDKSTSYGGNTVINTTKSSNKQHSTFSSRSTASVKPTVHNKQNPPVKPVQLTTPASSTISYQKSRPVVSVAPYKDKPEDGKDDGPVMIYTKSKQTTREEKLPVNQLSKEIKDEKIKQGNNIILPKEAKKLFDEDTNAKSAHNRKLSSHGRSVDVNNKNAENNTSDQSKKIQKMNQTSSHFMNVQKDALDRKQLSMEENSKSMVKEIDLKPIKPIASSSKMLTKPTRMAPEPPIQPDPSQKSMIVSTTQLIKKEPNKNPSSSIISHEDKQSEPSKDVSPINGPHQQGSSTMNDQSLKKINTDKPESQEEPIKGIPSIISRRLKQQNSSPGQAALDVVSSSNNHFNNTDSNSLYSRTLLSSTTVNSSSSDKAEKDTLGSEIENEITAVRRKMEANRLKAGAPAQIFDSSLLAKKKKKQISSEGLVPALELSSLTDDHIMEYQPQAAKIKPCNIVFIGENAKTSRSLLDKKRKIKINIHFTDLKVETFEYPSEETALERYLEDHPHEKEEILLLENISFVNGETEESSDDVEVDVYVSPSETGSESLLKSNTGLAHTGNLQSYRGRFQQDYEFGAILKEQPQNVIQPEPEVDPEKMMLRPAEEDDTNIWSTNDSSDLLF